jgi:hypothetical protein
VNKQDAIDFLEKTKTEITTKHEYVFVEENLAVAENDLKKIKESDDESDFKAMLINMGYDTDEVI